MPALIFATCIVAILVWILVDRHLEFREYLKDPEHNDPPFPFQRRAARQ